MWGGLPSAVTIGSGVAGAAVIAAHGVCVCVATLDEVIRVDFVQKTGWEFARGFSLLQEEDDAAGARIERGRKRALRGYANATLLCIQWLKALVIK